MYRPPNVYSNVFFNDFRLYLESVDTVNANTFICGDFNFWLDDVENRDARDFKELMDMFQFENKVENVTSSTGHMLDLIFCNMELSPVLNVCVDETNTISPVHKLVSFLIPFNIDVKQKKKISFRDKKSLRPDVVITKIISVIDNNKNELCLHNIHVNECVMCYTKLYNDTSKKEYDTACPMIEKEIVVKDRAPWFNSEIRLAKREKRRAEYIWRRRRTNSTRNAYSEARNRYNSCIKQRKRDYFTNKIRDAGNDMNKLYLILDNLTGCKKKKKLP